ncbi:hypothetical protein [uncultured Imperialibacter sp.]|uniref:hypothetical protein n=1 Tax=uncultured Imperialibacter sp. TaxID=1672639 RepID=UPI0030D90BB6
MVCLHPPYPPAASVSLVAILSLASASYWDVVSIRPMVASYPVAEGPNCKPTIAERRLHTLQPCFQACLGTTLFV